MARDELEPAYDYAVELNGSAVGEGEVTASSLQRVDRLSLGEKLEPGDENWLTLVRRGRGRLYYSAQLRSFPTAHEAPPLDEGIVLGRRYLVVDQKTLAPTGAVADRVSLGEAVEVRLTLVGDRTLHYVKLEDFLPAGLEAIDTSLATTSRLARAPGFADVSEAAVIEWWRRGWWQDWTRSELRDDRVLLYADRLPRGTHEYRYLARATIAGDYHVRPARAEEIYAPEVFGRSGGGLFSVDR